jgi:hypothetical protein
VTDDFVRETDHQARRITLRGQASPLMPALRDAVVSLLREPGVDADYSLTILLHPEAPLPTTDDVAASPDLLKLLRARLAGPIAIVASGTGHATPAALIADVASTDDAEVRWFPTEQEAEAWLRLAAHKSHQPH